MSLSSLSSLMIIHFLFDWVLQDRETAVNKSSNFKYLLAHLMLINTGLLLWGLLPSIELNKSQIFIFSITNTIMHGIIDWCVWRVYKLSVVKRFNDLQDFRYYEDRWFYNFIALDQLLHGLCYVIVFAMLTLG